MSNYRHRYAAGYLLYYTATSYTKHSKYINDLNMRNKIIKLREKIEGKAY